MSSREGYKTKEIGKIPEEWKIVQLGDDEENVAEVIMGQSPPSSSYNDSGKGLPFLQGNADFGYIYPKPAIYTSNPIKIARKHDTLISVRAPVGEVNLSPFKCCIGRGLSAIRTNPSKMNYLFAFYYIKYSVRRLTALAAGSTFTAVRKRDLEHFNLVMPPIPEQDKIAAILSTVDETIQKTDAVIRKTETLKRGLMQRLLTRGIDHAQFKQTELGEIPETWKIVKIDDVTIEVYRYPTYYNISYTKSGIPEIRGGLIRENGNIDEDFSKYRFISEETSKRFPRTKLQEGDLVMSVRGTMGKTGLISKKLEGANITANLMRISPDKSKCFPEFFKQFFLSEYFAREMNRLSPQTTIKTIKSSTLKSIKLPLPSVDEQKRISSILSMVDKKLRFEKRRKGKLEKLKKGLMQVLLTGRVRVKVD